MVDDREETAAADRWRWQVLGTFMFNTACNGFMFLDYAGNASVMKDLFRIDDPQLNWTYSAGLLTVVAVYVPTILLLRANNWLMVGIGAASNVLGAWLRLLAVQWESYPLALLSSVVIGVCAAVIVVSFVELVEAWFTPSWRSLATQLAVQANYAGWALSTLVVPYLGSSPGRLRGLLFHQGIVVSLCLPLFLLFHRSPSQARPQAPPARHTQQADDTEQAGSGWTELTRSTATLFRQPQFVLQAFCHSTLTGIGFTVPAVQDAIMGGMGFNDQEAGWAGFIFIASGVTGGMVLGVVLTSLRRSVRCMMLLYSIATAALTACAVLAFLHKHLGLLQQNQVLLAFYALMVPAGACSLGSLGPAMNIVVAVTHPTPEIYPSAIVELLVQALATALTQFSSTSDGYITLAAAAWLVTLLMLLFYYVPLPHGEDQQNHPKPPAVPTEVPGAAQRSPLLEDIARGYGGPESGAEDDEDTRGNTVTVNGSSR